MSTWSYLLAGYVLVALAVGVVWWHHDRDDVTVNDPMPLVGAVTVTVMFGWVFPFVFLLGVVPEHFEDKAWESGKTQERREKQAQRLERKIARHELSIRRIRHRQAQLRSGRRYISP